MNTAEKLMYEWKDQTHWVYFQALKANLPSLLRSRGTPCQGASPRRSRMMRKCQVRFWKTSRRGDPLAESNCMPSNKMKSEKEIDAFFEKINAFLAYYDLEDLSRTEGYSNTEINYYEQQLDLKFPYAYRKFLANYAKGSMRFFCGQTYRLDKIKNAFATAEELVRDNNETLPRNTFPFSQWQGYNFFYLENDKTEPWVYLYMEGKGKDGEWLFCDWVKWQIECEVRSRLKWDDLTNEEIIEELNQI